MLSRNLFRLQEAAETDSGYKRRAQNDVLYVQKASEYTERPLEKTRDLLGVARVGSPYNPRKSIEFK